MSLMAMSRVTKKYGVLIMSVMAALMVGGVVVSGLGSNLGGGGGASLVPKLSPDKPVATVGDHKITQPELDRLTENLVQQQMQQNPMGGKQPNPEDMDRIRLQAIETIKQQQALLAIAKTANITVTDSEIATEREKQWNEVIRPGLAAQLGLDAKADDNQLAGGLLKVNPNATVEAVKENALPDDRLRLKLTVDKLMAQYKTQVGTTDDAIRRSLSDTKVRHILVKFGTGALPEAQAKTKAEKLLAAVKANPASMGDLAKTNTDDEGSKKTGGVYDWTPSQRQGIVPEFSAALDTLKPGETYPELVRVSNPGYSGFHIIRLETVTTGKDFPKDFDTNKAKYTEDYVKARVNKRLEEAVTAATPNVPVTLSDPKLLAEQAIEDSFKAGADKKARDTKLDEALTQLGKITKTDDPLGVVPLKKAQIYSMQNKTKDAIAAYEDALTYRKAPETRLALAQAYIQDKQNDKAKEQLAEMANGVIPDPQMEMMIGAMYEQMGDKAKAAEAKKKGQEMQQRQMQALMQQFQQQQAAQKAAGGGAGAPPPGPATKK